MPTFQSHQCLVKLHANMLIFLVMAFRHMGQFLSDLLHFLHVLCPHRNTVSLRLSIQMEQFCASSSSRIFSFRSRSSASDGALEAPFNAKPVIKIILIENIKIKDYIVHKLRLRKWYFKSRPPQRKDKSLVTLQYS